MAKLLTQSCKEDFIVQMGGDYNLPFDEVKVQAKAGTILESNTTVATEVSASVLGILAEDTDGEGFARVMVRGNPTSVDAQALVGYEAAHKALLEAKGVVVVND